MDSFECVKLADTHNIESSLRAMFNFGHDNPIYRWLPVIEPKIDGEHQFLTQDPIASWKAGDFQAIPILISATKNEATSSSMYLFEHRDLLKQFLNDFRRIFPICFSYEPNNTISNALKDWYIKYNFDDRDHYGDLFDEIAQVSGKNNSNFLRN